MKKLILFFLCVNLLILATAGCGSEQDNNSQSVVITSKIDDHSSSLSSKVVVDTQNSSEYNDNSTGLYSDEVYEAMTRICNYGEIDSAMNTLSDIPNNPFASSISNNYNSLIELCSSQLERDIAKGMLAATDLLSISTCNFNWIKVSNVWIVNYDEPAVVAEHSNDVLLEITFGDENSNYHGYVIVESFTSPEAIESRFIATEKVEAHIALTYVYGNALDSVIDSMWGYYGIDPKSSFGITKAVKNYEENSGLQYRKLTNDEFSNFNTILNHPIYSLLCPYWEIHLEITNKKIGGQFNSNSSNTPSNSEPRIGMTPDQVRKSSWGEPQKINRSTYSYAVKEQWVYRKGYIYFENGIVTSIQEQVK